MPANSRYGGLLGCIELNCENVVLSNLDLATSGFSNAGITALIKPINPTYMPGYF